MPLLWRLRLRNLVPRPTAHPVTQTIRSFGHSAPLCRAAPITAVTLELGGAELHAMPFKPGPARFHLEHHTAPAWPSVVVTFDEVERHLRRPTKLPCGCMRYMQYTSRPKARLWLSDGTSREVKVARLMATLFADRPLARNDYATHACDNPVCANPDHCRPASHASNMRDRSRPGRPIRERRDARFYDHLLLDIPAAPPLPPEMVRRVGRPIGYSSVPPKVIAAGAVLTCQSTPLARTALRPLLLAS